MQFKQTFLAAAAVIAAKAQEDTASANLTSVLAGNENLSALVSLLQSQPAIATALGGAENITLLAPSNDALRALNSSSMMASQEGYIQALLKYHVLVGEFPSDAITTTPVFPQTLLNDTMYTNVTGGQVVECRVSDDEVLVITGLKNNVTVTEADIAFDGGVIHIIDGLLTIPPEVGTVAQEAGLSALLGALNATDLVDTVSTAPDLTIFAPNNAAFEDISSALADLSTEEIASILQYHVISGTVAYSSTLSNGTVPTLGGDNITISIIDGEVFVNRARVVTADILLANGVLHVIDSVLSTNSSQPADGSESDEPTNAFPGASSGDLAFTSGIPSPTSTNAALTTEVIAVLTNYPTNTNPVGENPNGNPEATAIIASGSDSTTSEDSAAMPTGAVGAAALFGFGGAAIMANM